MPMHGSTVGYIMILTWKSTLFSEHCAQNSIYNTALQLFVIWLHDLSLKMPILSEEERWEDDFGPL